MAIVKLLLIIAAGWAAGTITGKHNLPFGVAIVLILVAFVLIEAIFVTI